MRMSASTSHLPKTCTINPPTHIINQNNDAEKRLEHDLAMIDQKLRNKSRLLPAINVPLSIPPQKNWLDDMQTISQHNKLN